jgi:predicted ATPase
VRNFRSLKDVDLSLEPLNVLVGPNGAGKSNLLDVIGFLGDSVREDLGPALAKRGGFDRVCFRGKIDGPRQVVIEVEAAVTKNSSRAATDNYTLDFQVLRIRRIRSDNAPRRYLRRRETFLFKRTAGPGRRITVSGGDITVMDGDETTTTGTLREGSLGLATLPRLGPSQGAEQVDALAGLFASFRVFDVDVGRARLPSIVQRAPSLNNDAGNLSAFLQYMAAEEPERFQALEKDACSFIPGLRSIDFESVGGATEATVLKLHEHGLPDSTDLADASYGSVRALALLALLYDPRPPRLTCIEEIDHGLHPHILDRLVELIRDASRRTQLLIATHSPALVNRLNASELIVCERRADATSAIPAISSAEVRRMEQELDGQLGLGELWFTGALGGVPES